MIAATLSLRYTNMKLSSRLLSSFPALVTRGKAPATVETLSRSDLPSSSTVKTQPGDCDLLVKVQYSTLNYKDALVVSGKYPGLKPPMVGGIDLVGTVLEAGPGSVHKAGDQVLCNGWGVGTDHWGGYAGEARLQSAWALPLPSGLTSRQAAQVGTAGYTAMLCVQALEKAGVVPDSGKVLVSGTPGGVGSVATLLLSQLGYHVVAVTGPDNSQADSDFLKSLGAAELLDRSSLQGEPRPLGKELYSGAVDSAGGKVLANVLPLIKHSGAVACCGLAAGMDLSTTVAPFILRGVTLAGVDSVFMPRDIRLQAYNKFAPILAGGKLELLAGDNKTVGLNGVLDLANLMLKGNLSGRYVVDVNA